MIHPMNKLTLIVLAIVSLVGFSLGTLAAEPTLEKSQRLNVLFIVSDDLRPELGCYGNAHIKSPNIDRLARQGIVFERAYCQQAVCSPSRTSVLTGARPDTTKVWDLRTHFRTALPDVTTLPQHFKNHGYASQSIGKIYHNGFDDEPSWTIKSQRRSKPSRRTRPSAAESGKPEVKSPIKHASVTDIQLTKTDRGPAFSITDDPPNGGGDGEVADRAIEALRKLKKGTQPFFLGVGFYKPHLPFSAPKVYWDMYDGDKIPMAPNRFLPKNAPDFALVDKAEVWNYSDVPDVAHFPDDYARQMKHGYYAAVSYMDAQLGRVLAELDALELRENTIVILWGDHGWKLGDHDRWAKHSNFEIDARAPLIISAPGMKAVGKKTYALVEFVDIYPTLAELAELPLPNHLEGTSLKPLLHDADLSWKAAAFSQYPRTAKGRKLMGYSMRTDRYRFTRWVERNDHAKVFAVELYDHLHDPQENTNIAGDPANAELVAKLTAQCQLGWKGHLIESSEQSP